MNNLKINKQRGFTLIELVIVIVILGILAITAAPKFLNLQTDARQSTLVGLESAFKGANASLHSKAALAGTEGEASSTITTDGQNINLVYGNIKASVDDIEKALGLSAGVDWYIKMSSMTANAAVISQSGSSSTSTGDVDESIECYLKYTQKQNANTDPTYEIMDDDC